MLDLVDALLTGIFAYVVPVLMGMLCVGTFVAGAYCLKGAKRNWRSCEVPARFLTLCGLAYSFFPFRQSFIDASPDTAAANPVIPVGLALFLVAVCTGVVSGLHRIRVPFVVLVCLVWGVIVIGW